MKSGTYTFLEMIAAKEAIEKNIVDSINDFQKIYGVPVNSLNLVFVHGRLPGAMPKVVGVKFNIEI